MQASLKPSRYLFFISRTLFLPFHTGKKICLRITLKTFQVWAFRQILSKKKKRKKTIFFYEEEIHFLQRYGKTVKTLHD